MLDTTRRVATPEGIELTLHLAGPVPRALAFTHGATTTGSDGYLASHAVSQRTTS